MNADVAEAYSVGQVAEQAIVATGGTDNAKIIAYLHSGVTLNTVQGPVKFDSLGENGLAAAFVFQWQGNGTKFVQVLPQGATASVTIIKKSPWARADRASGLTDQHHVLTDQDGAFMAREISQAIVDGILIGGVYALMAAGLTLIFGVLDIINIAQGVLVILGAYLSYSLFTKAHIDVFVGLLVTVPAMFIIGVVIHWAFIRRLRGTERTSMTLLVTYAVALIIEGILYKIYGANFVQINAPSTNSTVHVFGFYIEYIYIYGFIMAVALVVALYALLYRTRFGRSVRATMQDETAARLVGIDVNRVAALTFGIGVAVTAAGGMVYGATNSFNANSGYDLISRLLAIIILGGMGSLGGALGAAVFMITLESVVTIWYPTWAVAVFYAALVLVLVIRPNGFFGRKAVRAQ